MLRKQFFVQVRSAHAIALVALLLVGAGAVMPAEAQTYTVLHDFTDSPDGAIPNPIIRDAQGNLYGTTKYGGIATCGLGTCGTVFKVDSAGKETVLYSFEGGTNGTNPDAGLVRDPSGNLYGTTQGNGFIDGSAVVFKLEPNGRETSLDIAGPNACCFDSPLALDATRQPLWHVALRGHTELRFGREPVGLWNIIQTHARRQIHGAAHLYRNGRNTT